METKLDSRQAQFPATFPDTFKNFFEMMNEDEDHIDIFSNLLEDKVIPRASNNNMFAQRRCGGSLRCSTHPHSNGGSSSSDMTSESLGGGMNTNTIRLDGRSSGGGSGGGGGILVGRSNSFRINRARNSFCATGLNKIGIVGEDSARCSGIGRGGGGGGEECCDAVGDGGGGGGGGIGSSLFCKHIKYCCLHQHSTQQQQQPSTHKSSSQQLYMQQQQQRYHQQQQQQQQKQQQPHNFNQKNYYDFSSNVVGTSHHASNNSIALGSSATRLGPDGEDIESNGGGGGNSGGITGDTNSGPAVKKSLLLLSDMTAAIKIRFQKQQTQTKTQTQQHQHQQQEEKQQLQKRHSVILERAFDFDVSCDESDTLSIQSPTTTGKLLNATVATAKAPQSAPATTYSVLKPILMHSQQQQQQQQLPTEAPPPPHPPPMQGLSTHMHRLLPQPPKNFGVGAFHTKETALQRVQQQSGLLSNATSKVNLQGCLHHASTSAEASATQQQQQAHYNDTMSNDFSSNYSNYQMDALHSPTAAPPPPLPLPPPTTTTRHLPHHQQQQQQQQQLVTGSVDASLLNAAHCSSSRTALSSIRCQKSPILHRRRSSSIAANLLHAGHGYTHSSSSNIADDFGKHGDDSMRDRITMAKSPVSRFNMNSMMQLPIPVESGVLTFQQALSGAVSPQYSVTSPFLQMGAIGGNRSTTATEPGEGVVNVGIGSISNRNISEIAGSCTALASVLEDTNTSGPDVSDDSPNGCDAPLSTGELHPLAGQFSSQQQQQQQQQQRGERGEAAGIPEHGSSVTVSHLGNRQRQRMRTSSMPAENRKPRLVDTRRAAIHCADIDMEYYRLRSFSITSHGVCHLGDSLRSRRSRSINSVTSTGTSNSGVDRHNSNASRTSDDVLLVPGDGAGHQTEIPAYKIAMLGGSGVGKTTLTYQFTTSDYICAYDLSLDDDYGQKTVSVLVDNIETDLEIIDHPSCEMSTEAFCSTYNIDLFVVVYSVVDRSTFKAAEKVLHYLKENEMLLTRGAILVGNKTDLERHREVTRQMGRKVAKEIACKFIETSSGLDHNVDELLVGIVAQVKLNPQRIRNLSERDQQRLNLQSTIQKHRRMHTPQRRIVRQMSMFQDDDDADHDVATASTSAAAAAAAAPDTSCANVCDKATAMHANDSSTASITATVAANVAKLHRGGVVRKPHRRTLNLESILKMGESELEDEEEAQRLQMQGLRAITKFELLTSGIKPPYTFARARTALSTPQNNANPSNNESTSESTTDALLGAVGGSGSDGGNSGTVRGHKTMTRLTTRTKILLSSVLRFKRAILIKRRNSSSCSDLFVI